MHGNNVKGNCRKFLFLHGYNFLTVPVIICLAQSFPLFNNRMTRIISGDESYETNLSIRHEYLLRYIAFSQVLKKYHHKLLLTYGFRHVTMCDHEGIIGKDYPNLNWMQQKMTEVTNLENQNGTLADALKGADIFVGVSAPNIVTPEMVASMNHDSILFAMANPVPEIMPDEAEAAGARIVGTGRSDFPNQVNNVVAFPGIFKGALEGRATQITEEMKLAAAEAIAGLVSDEELNDEFIMPEAFDPRVAQVVSEAVRSHIVR